MFKNFFIQIPDHFIIGIGRQKKPIYKNKSIVLEAAYDIYRSFLTENHFITSF